MRPQISVEREKEYTDLPVEEGGHRLRVPTTERQRQRLLRSTPAQPDAVVPAGDVVFKNVSVRYRLGQRAALRDVTLHVHPGQKVGVVGRTGGLHEGWRQLVQAQGFSPGLCIGRRRKEHAHWRAVAPHAILGHHHSRRNRRVTAPAACT